MYRTVFFSQENLEIHRAGFKSISMHNLSDLVQQALATNVCLSSLHLLFFLGGGGVKNKSQFFFMNLSCHLAAPVYLSRQCKVGNLTFQTWQKILQM